MATCAYSLQYASSQIDELDERGIASSADILRAFDAFDWPGQVAEASQLQRCSPTFSVRDDAGGRLLWVSAFGAPGEFQFVCSYTFPAERRKLFGLLKYKGPIGPRTRSLSRRSASSRRAVPGREPRGAAAPRLQVIGTRARNAR